VLKLSLVCVRAITVKVPLLTALVSVLVPFSIALEVMVIIIPVNLLNTLKIARWFDIISIIVLLLRLKQFGLTTKRNALRNSLS